MMNYVVIYKSKYGLSGYRYMYARNAEEVKTVFTTAYPERDIEGIFVSVDNMKTCIQSLIDFI